MAADEEGANSKAVEPAAKAVSLRSEVRRARRGSLRGSIHIAEDFADLPDDLADAFGTR